MRLAVAEGARQVILELDNLTLVNYLKAETGGRSSIAGLWHEIRELSRACDCFCIEIRELSRAVSVFLLLGVKLIRHGTVVPES